MMNINASKIYKIRIRYSVPAGGARSALCAAMRNIVRASDLPYETAKANGWPRLTFGPALGDGLASGSEYVDMYFSKAVDVNEVLAALNKHKEEGLVFLGAKRVPYAFPSVESLAAAVQVSAQINGQEIKETISTGFFAEGIAKLKANGAQNIVKENLFWKAADGSLRDI